jgi:hypothetical protein
MLALKELQREYGASWNAVPAQNKQQLINERMAVRVAPHDMPHDGSNSHPLID